MSTAVIVKQRTVLSGARVLLVIASLGFMVFCHVPSQAQARGGPPAILSPALGSASGNLTVIATVVSSVGIVLGPHGEETLVFANSPDPADNVSHLIPMTTATAHSGHKKASRHPR